MKTVVELDLVGYSDVCRTLEENVGVHVVAEFNDQIQGFVDAGLSACGAQRSKVVMATTGDGAILVFDDAPSAHKFAEAVHSATQKHNETKVTASAQRWFRIGAATGELHQGPRAGGGQEIAGTVIANAVRLEGNARPGQLVVDLPTFDGLPDDAKKIYGGDETVYGKRQERFTVRRCTFVPYGAADEGPPSVLDILERFDRLNPRNQVDRLMMVVGMPIAHRPSDTLPLYRRQDAIVDWAAGQGEPGLRKLFSALNALSKQPPLS